MKAYAIKKVSQYFCHYRRWGELRRAEFFVTSQEAKNTMIYFALVGAEVVPIKIEEFPKGSFQRTVNPKKVVHFVGHADRSACGKIEGIHFHESNSTCLFNDTTCKNCLAIIRSNTKPL